MIGIVATFKIKEGAEAVFEKGFSDLAAKVKANEPGNLFYQLTRSRADKSVYKVLELYASQDAITAHGQSDYFKAAGREVFAPALAGAPEIEYLDAVE